MTISNLNIKIKKLAPNATFTKGSKDAVGYDLTCVDAHYKDGIGYLHLGVAVEPPSDGWFQLVPRSSFPKTGWIMANGVGIIDPDYRGEWLMPIFRIGKVFNCLCIEDFINTRVAQAILMLICDPFKHLQVLEVEDLGKTERGDGGFGSTGQ